MTSLYMGFQIYSLTKRLVALSTFVGLHCDCPLARRKKYEPPLKQILVTASPKFGESEGELGMPDSNENEILFPSETNPNCSSPKFGEVRGALREPEAVFRHFVMKKSEPKARQFTLEVHGWCNQLKKPELRPFFTELRPVKDSAPADRGLTLLSHHQKQIQISTDGETSELV